MWKKYQGLVYQDKAKNPDLKVEVLYYPERSEGSGVILSGVGAAVAL